MKRNALIALSFSVLLGACGPTPSSPDFAIPYGSPTPSATGIPSSDLSNLLTGQVVSGQEAQLRDTLKRKVLLDFPVKVGVLFYNFNSELDAVDKEAVFDDLRNGLKSSEIISETIEIPQSLVGGINIENLRQVGARFQTDVIVLITGSHNFERSRDQSIGFFDSFSNALNYQSQVKIEAIALDVFTGTLLSPFDAASKGEKILLDRSASDYAAKAYAYQKQVETKAWKALEIEALERFAQLKINVEKSRQEIALEPSPEPTPTPEPSSSASAQSSQEAAE